MASDVHLGPHIPHTNQTFFQFLQQASQEAKALILAGDIFNVWFGDDLAVTHPEPWLQQALVALADCAQKIPVYFIHGNRDFLVGADLCQRLGIHLLPEQVLLKTDAGVIFISHGDELCTHDKGYMRLRKILRCPAIQGVFLNLPLTWRQGIANFLRQRSKTAQHQQNASYHRDYDIDSKTLDKIIQQYPEIDYVVHGHTHKEAIHHLINTIDNKKRLRYVLSDWDMDNATPRAAYLNIHPSGLTLHSLVKPPQ